MNILLAGIAVIVVALAIFYFTILRRANPPLRNDQVSVGSGAFTVEVASTTIEQTRGLSFRTGLDQGHGMLFLFSSAGIQNFWMKDMNFPIDIIWIAGENVAGFVENAEPQPGVALWNLKIYSSPDGVDKVLEVVAGTVAKDNIKVGDPVVIGSGVR